MCYSKCLSLPSFVEALSQNDHASILKALQEVKKTEEQHSEASPLGFPTS